MPTANGNQTGAAVVLLSGGMDSSVLLHHVKKELGRTQLHTISYHYGQRHLKELDCARWQSEAAGATKYTVVDISFMAGILCHGSTLVSGGAEVPDFRDLAPNDLDQPPTYVPNRNMMLLAIAAAYAESHGAEDVFYGAQALDEYGYWDCTAEFVDRLNRVFTLNRRNKVTIHAPFLRRKKHEIAQLGGRLGVDFAHTWSCYRGGETCCGTCPTCIERIKAFAEAGMDDPLPYADDGQDAKQNLTR